MPVGLLTLELHFPEAQSLKDKRQVLRSLKDRLRRQFNVAVAELDFQDTWQSSVVGVVTLSNEEQHVEEVLQKVLAEADRISGSTADFARRRFAVIRFVARCGNNVGQRVYETGLALTMSPDHHRHERVGEEIAHEINAMLAGELKDPRLEAW